MISGSYSIVLTDCLEGQAFPEERKKGGFRYAALDGISILFLRGILVERSRYWK